MRVACIAHQASKEGAGLFLLDAIDFFRTQGIDVIVILPRLGPLAEALAERGVECRYVASPWWAQPTAALPYRATLDAARQISAALTQWGAEMVYTNTIVAPAGAFAAALTGLPHIWHVHEFAYNPDQIEMALPQRDLAALMMGTSNAILFNSLAVAAEWGSLLARVRTAIVYNWTRRQDERHYESDCFTAGQQLERLRNRSFFSHIASVCGFKRQVDSLRALKDLVGEGYDIVLVLAGSILDQAYYAQLCAYVQDNHLDDHVWFTGFIESPAAVLQHSLANLVCSRLEPFGRITIESMAVGVPVIVAAGAGTAEIIQDDVNGLLFPPGDTDALTRQMRRLLVDRELWKRLSIQGWERAERFMSPEREMGPVVRLMYDMREERNPSWPLGHYFSLGLAFDKLRPSAMAKVKRLWRWYARRA